MYKINLDKMEFNRAVSDLKPGDKVRRNVMVKQQKGTEPKWSDEVYTVSKTQGQTMTLDNGEQFRRYQLLKVPATAKTTPMNVVRLINKYKMILK